MATRRGASIVRKDKRERERVDKGDGERSLDAEMKKKKRKGSIARSPESGGGDEGVPRGKAGWKRGLRSRTVCGGRFRTGRTRASASICLYARVYVRLSRPRDMNRELVNARARRNIMRHRPR